MGWLRKRMTTANLLYHLLPGLTLSAIGLGLIGLCHLPVRYWLCRRRRIAEFYNSQLSTLNPQLFLPFVPNWAEPAWYLFAVRHPRRHMLQTRLAEAGIGTLIHYPVPPHLSGAYTDAAIPQSSRPGAEKLADSVLSLPIGPHVSSEDVKCVVEALNRVTCLLY
jgi:dTDP-4-amino-4,6-dideoxygalactose transaminase